MKIRLSLCILLAGIVTTTLSIHAQNQFPVYRFSKGQKIHYQRVLEQNSPVFDDSYMQTQECEIVVENVDAAGNARIALSILKDTLLYMGMTQGTPSGMTQAKLQPKIRFTISPRGAITSGTILQYSEHYRQLQQLAAQGNRIKMLSDSERVAHEASIWLPPVPPVGSTMQTVLVDTTVRVVEVASTTDSSAGQFQAVVKQNDSTITGIRVVGTRDYAGVECQRVVRTTWSRQPFTGNRLLYR
jgi:hypothetical protein